MKPEFLKDYKLSHETDTAEWYADKITTDYCHRKNIDGKSLPNRYCFIVYLKQEGACERLLVEYSSGGAQGVVVYATTSLDDMAARIDILKSLQK